MYNVSTMFNAAIVANQDQRLLIKWGDNAILTAEDISATDGGLKYTEYANPDEDLTIGQAVQSALELYLLNADGKAGTLIQSKGKTLFTALLGVKLVGAASDTGQDIATGATLAVVLNNGGSNKIAVSANPSWGYIVHNGAQIVVSGAVHALAAMDGHLYLIGSGGAILGQYAYSSDAATLTEETAVTPEEITKDKLSLWASAHKCATLEGLKAYDFTISGGNILAERWEYAPLGNFIAEKPSKTQDDIITVSAYDQMSLFDRDATSFISGLTFPLTLTQLFVKLCEYVKIGYKSGTLINGSVSYSASTFIADGYTLRDIFSFIAETAGGFARINRDGAAEIAWFASSGRTIGKKQRFSLDLAEYTTKAVGGISIKNTNSDAVCTYPEEIADDAQIYTTVDNPLLIASTVAEMQTRAQPVFNRLSAVSAYRPAAVECVSNWAVQAGDLISIEADGGNYYTVPIFTQSISWAGFATAEMEATGSETRGIDAEKNQAVRDGKRLYESGKEINALAERVSTAETQIAQNATEISLRATKTELDGLQIGGVNLMLDTKAYGGNGGANYTIVAPLQTETYNGFTVRRGENTSDANALQFQMAYAFQPGESYTLSFWGKGSGAAQALITGYAYPCTSVSSEGTAGTDAGGANTFNVTSDWKRYWITFTMGNWATVPTGKELWLRARNSTSGRVLDVCGLKLERGSRATDWSPSPEDPARSVKTSSVTVNGAGIWLDSTGEISLAAGGKINIQSGADAGNQILLGDLFSATDQGGVTGKTANFGSLLVGGNPAAALGGNIVVASAQPSGNGILWLKPNSVATVQYQRATPSTRSWWLDGTRVIESIAAKTTDVLPGGTIHYKLTLPLYALSRLEGVVVAPKLTKSGISGEVALGAQTISILGLNVLTLEGESAINLGAAPGTPITLSLTVTNGDSQKLFVQSDTTIQLEISNRTVATGGVQALEAYWIP